MGLMYGTGPFGRSAAGEFNFSPPPPGTALYLEPTPRRVRVVVGEETIADSRRAFLLHESGLQPAYYFPPQDVRLDLLEPTEHHTRCPKKGQASYYTVRVGDRAVENGAWFYPEPIEQAPANLRGLIAFYFDRMDRWLEEAEEIGVHPRDPYHRIDTVASDRHIRVSLEGEVLAETGSAVALFETGLPVRWYIPAQDVCAELEDSGTVTHCPYKGEAAYRSVKAADGTVHEDLIWYYPDPRPEAIGVTGRLCFFNERVDLELDGELQERPESARNRARVGAR
jgi:uncharacterized protein (DUF427 family)